MANDLHSVYPDVELFDPITKRTFSGDKTWCEVAVDYIQWGDTVYGLPIDEKTPRKYWVHGIALSHSDTQHPNFPFKRGQPILINTKQESFAGVVDSFTLETASKLEGNIYNFTFVLVPMDMLTFVELVNNLRENYYEYKVKETPSESDPQN